MNRIMPLLLLGTSLAPAVIIFCLADDSRRTRTAVNIVGALLKLALVAVMLEGVRSGEAYEFRHALLPGLDLVLRADALALLFLTLSAFLWLLTTIYAIAYFGESADLSRFFGFFSLCVAATTGVALAGSLVTFFVFYELLTLATWPLVAHKGKEDSIAAGRKYLRYTMCGSAALLAGIVFLESKVGPIEFTARGMLDDVTAFDLRVAFALLIGGLAVKAAIVPLHGWLPAAMVAPAPVSALLHAVAVVKAGAFGIVRVIYDVYGFALVDSIGVGLPLAVLAAITIVYGSLKALLQSDIKRRLAYSTISQISYIVLGATLLGSMATIGGLVHLVHQGLMKITLFFCAGALAERAGVTRVDQLDGIALRMPITMAAFTIAALGMIGVPPVAGFISKWHLGVGAVQAGQNWALFALAASSLLNAAYFLPLLVRAWLHPLADPDSTRPPAGDEGPGWLIAPAAITAAVALGAGLFAAFVYSPLGWATLIVETEYPFLDAQPGGSTP